jgi:hypothetical protein
MNIFFKNLNDVNNESEIPTRQVVEVETTHKFLSEMYGVLKDEINRQEQVAKDKDLVAYIMIIRQTTRLGFEYHNYTEDLIKKIHSCNTPENIRYLNDLINRNYLNLL